MGNSESSSQLPAGADGRRGAVRRDNSEEENDATLSTSIEKAVKVGAKVAGTALVAWGAWNLATSSRSTERPEDDRPGSAVGAANTLLEGACQAAGRISRGGRGLIPNKDYFFYQPEINYQKFMTYNVWKQEVTDRFGRVWPERIEAIGRLLEEHDPDVIFFQEVTPNIYQNFQRFNWWKYYECWDSSEEATGGDFLIVLSKLPIESKSYISTIGREIPICKLDAGSGRRLLVANGHLKCHNSPAEINREIRKTQAKAVMDTLDNSSNAVFGGDMNWTEKKDGPFPLREGWVDAWTYLKGSDDGYTYDTKSNEHLKDRRTLQERLDRFVCKLSDFSLIDIELIGTEAYPPSDHYGLLLTIC
ncbi:uncharacterized protein LOC109708424 [Ananas comosus]|uniref:Uncharacterized protein LOC109708424 n=1 Tax=Ananas comosus TaxID=4615 RepID=A0A6P5EQF5_ANACO|nr:uncharacterized protein LOC109708424 [Ananas comosus]